MGIQINGQTDTISAFDNNFSLAGNVSIGGTLTYEDVTSVDAVGLSTFQAGIHLDDSIIHLGDTDTAIRFPADDTITAETAGTERLRITSGGNIGIGEISPDVRLHVKKQFDTAYSLTNVADEANHLLKLENPSTTANAFSGMQFRVGSGADLFFGAIQQSVNHGDFFFTNQNSPNQEMMRIKSTGLVGINSTSPATALDIQSTKNSDGLTVTKGSNVSAFLGHNGSGDEGLLLLKEGGTTKVLIYAETNQNSYFNSGGSVGIGTNNPTGKLEVVHASQTDLLKLKRTSGNNGVFTISLGGAVPGTIFSTSGVCDDFVFNAGSERLRIQSDGRVGINRVSSSFMLDIVGNSSTGANCIRITDGAETGHGSHPAKIVAGGTYYHEMQMHSRRFAVHTYDGSSITERFRVHQTGQVLVGNYATHSAIHGNLEVNGNDGINISNATRTGSNGAQWRLIPHNGGGSVTNLRLFEGAGGTEVINITKTGFVGINETAPGAQLTVKRANTSTSGLLGVLKLKQGSATNGNRASLLFSSLDDYDVAAVNGTILTHSGTSSNNEGRLEFWTKNSGSDIAERVRIQPTGFVQIGSGYLNSTAYHRINGINQTQGSAIFVVSGYQASGGSNQDTAVFYSVNNNGSPNAAGTCMRVFRDTVSLRSINAAGTLNASGNDYAEYMTKAGDFTLAKGDVCGVNSEGKLTNVFADAVSFVVKSTDPSYVGGDKWHEVAGVEPGGYDDTRTEEEIADAKVVYQEALESARQLVDRIAFCGQVPVNVTGATPGQHIIPTAASDGSIEGTAKAEADLTMSEYISSVGKIIAIEDDGRARIIVKIS